MKIAILRKTVIYVLLFNPLHLTHSETNNDLNTKTYNKKIQYESNEVIVTATRENKTVFESPYTIQVIEKEDLEHKQIRNLPEALTETAGVLVQKTANGQGSPLIRGFTGYRTLALIDGIRYNNSVYRDGPNEYFSLIDVNSLENIEVLNGPASMLYGSDAIGGTLNLTTQSSNYEYEIADERFIHGSQSVRLSSAENSQLSRTEIKLGKGKIWGMHLGLSYKEFGNIEAANLGTLEKTGYDEYAYDTRFDIKLNEQWDATIVHQNLHQNDVWRTHSTLFSKSFAGTTVGTDLKRSKDQTRSLSYLKFSGNKLEQFFDTAKLTLSYQTWDESGDRVRANSNRILESFDSRMFGMDMQLSSDTNFGQFIYGIDYYHDSVDSHRTDFNADGSINRIRIQGPIGDDSSYDLLGAYIQGEFILSDRITITAGSRITYTKADVGRFEDPDTGLSATYQDDWLSQVNSLRASYSLNQSNSLKLWSGISQSFRAPNIADISRFGASRSNETEVAATNLDPEKFLTFEIGFKTDLPKLNMTGTYYYTDIKDFITSTPTGRIVGGLTEVSKQNSSEGFVQGIELSTRYYFDNGFETYGNITWLEGELNVFNTSTIASSAEPLSRLMPITSTLGIKWVNLDETLWFDTSITLAAKAHKLSSGDISDTQRIPPGGTPAYSLVNLRTGKQFNDHFEMNFVINNIFDEAYRSHGSGSNEPGFNAILGFKASF